MMQQKTPGVYVEEVSKFPPSVAGVATAIPAFIGFTEKGERFVPVKVTSLLDYTTKFGDSCTLTIDSDGNLHGHKFVMHDSIRLFYDNGGGTCYVIPVGNYEATEFTAATYAGENNKLLTQLEKVDEITMICLPDAALLMQQDQLDSLQKTILSHCGEMKDRIAILDPKEGENLDTTMLNFRGGIGMNSLSYGVAYYPYLKTTYTKEIRFGEMLNNKKIKETAEKLKVDDTKGFGKNYTDYTTPDDCSLVIDELKNEYEKEGNRNDSLSKELDRFSDSDGDTGNGLEYNASIKNPEDFSLSAFVYNEILRQKDNEGNPLSFNEAKSQLKKIYGDEKTRYETLSNLIQKFSFVDGKIKDPEKDDLTEEEKNYLSKVQKDLAAKIKETCKPEFGNETLEKAMMVQIDKDNENCYSKALAAYQAEASVITPCGAIAGIYCATDNSKGVWQAPANVSINSVSDLTEMISEKEQRDMNVDTTSGKSVNAIRFFTGKGILVWGARTLDGNSKEWCYVSVRRLFNYIEESVQKSTAWAVFQPNDSSTWMKIQCQIENFLTSLWREGALAGATPDKAFFVNVGLGITMTADDIYNGNLIVEIGLAAVRPAEFIILQFSHKVQE